MHRVGIDTGGTFTDVASLSGSGLQIHKLPSTPDDPATAVLEGLAAVRGDRPVDVVHGSTVGLNAVLTGEVARTAFVTNEGFRDLIEIARQERSSLYDLAASRSVLPVPRRCASRSPVGERQTAICWRGLRLASCGRCATSCAAPACRPSRSACCTATRIPRTSARSRERWPSSGPGHLQRRAAARASASTNASRRP